MKVRELIALLEELDPELVVVKQKDDEGNGYSPLYCVDDDAYVQDLEDRDLEVISGFDIEEMDWDVTIQVCVLV